MLLVSCCLVGQIRVWDAQTGDCLTVIPKPRYVIALRSLSSQHNPFWKKSAATVLGAVSIPATTMLVHTNSCCLCGCDIPVPIPNSLTR